MAYHTMLTMLADNVGVSVDIILLLVFIMPSLIFYAKNVQLGLSMTFLLSGLSFMVSFYFGGNWLPAMVVMCIFLIFMAFSFYAVGKAAAKGSII